MTVARESIVDIVEKSRSRRIWIAVLFGVMLASIFSSLAFGTVGPIGAGIPSRMSWGDFFNSIVAEGPASNILINLRLPRILLACAVGAALSISGAVMQCLFRNPLAEPYILGVSSGAAVGVSLGLIWGLTSLLSTPILAFSGALITVAAVYGIAQVRGRIKTDTLLLAGVAIASFLSAVSFYMLYAAGKDRDLIISWIMGSFALTTFDEVLITTFVLVMGGLLVFLFARDMNVMLMGEETAKQLGVDADTVKIIVLATASILAAIAVAFVGIVGFVGLIIPHIVRMTLGPDNRILIPASAFAGATFLIWMDVLARTVAGGQEIPIGIITAFCGAPFFIYLLRSRKTGYAYAS
ncbi:MAG: iron chelate uptake ABC transporter family permease subunit [Thermoplasmata archaeon]|nr:iron chelate uptake ABC transporter family permease subunit [Thermoplasmata archaeon]MCK4455556.1 iron chelate uptake ABC transporter family permease subunit [Thermoplasmata archaeon]